jgi:hypothetical protein
MEQAERPRDGRTLGSSVPAVLLGPAKQAGWKVESYPIPLQSAYIEERKRRTHVLTPGQSTGTFCTWHLRSNSFGMYPDQMPAGRPRTRVKSLSDGPCRPYGLAGWAVVAE